MVTETSQQLILDHLSTRVLKNKLAKLESVYSYVGDEKLRHKMLLTIDDFKIELMKRGEID